MIGLATEAAASAFVPDTGTLISKVWEAVVATIALGALYKLGDLIFARRRRVNEYRTALELLELERRVDNLAKDHADLGPMVSSLQQAYGDISPSAHLANGPPTRKRQMDDLFIAVLPCLVVALIFIGELQGASGETEMNYLILISSLCCAVFGGPWIEKRVNRWTQRRIPGYFLAFIMGCGLAFVSGVLAGMSSAIIGIG
ncbi:hypothetical protein KHP62_16700 [Rhodobacteraceae bacterium NNCM2]|nr:hypothetical protein [Coraliihabitans acroporae]